MTETAAAPMESTAERICRERKNTMMNANANSGVSSAVIAK